MKNAVLIACAVLLLASSTGLAASWKETPGLYAVIETNHGTIVVELYQKEAPKTVANFVGLAEGLTEYKDPNLGTMVKRRYFDGQSFHRVIPGFMMQGGDPLGSGAGGPGYTIPDEFVDSLKFDVPGRLAMANTGRPNSGGSQFFITQVPTPHLNGKHTIFGQVVEGQGVVDKVCSTIGTAAGKPKEPVIMKKVLIERVGGKAAEETKPKP